ncbi:MAG: response regulator [Alphaproteobacteria bacterium]|nr:response regulator [Alphaproteobacteria bacterium]
MRAPFSLPANDAASQALDAAGRTWRISAPVGGQRFATTEVKREPDAAHRFTAAVSHEIRTPLNGILGMAALLEESPLEPSEREYVAAIRKSGSRLLDLLNNVLDYSRLQNGDIPLEAAPFDPAELVQDAAELLSTRAHAAGLDIAAIVDPDLPSRMIGDEGRLRQILFNLVGNAVKFTSAGAILIEARRGPAGKGLSLIVRDTGAGIPEGARARLFDAFGQANASDSRRDGGVGLGLAIVSRLVEAMKGEVDFASTPGEGTQFRFDVPIDDVAGLSSPTEQHPEYAPSPQRRDLAVMLDLPAASELAVLSALAGDGASAVKTAQSADLAVVDAASPPAQIEALAKRVPTLVVLRPEDRALISQFRDMGCAGYLIRPLRAASVVERARLAMAGDVQAEPVETREPGAAGRVLIADDNAVNALLATRALTAAGFRVDTAGTGAEALELAESASYSVVFMDIRMPVMDGLEATRRIRRLGGLKGKTPVIALTADIDPELEDRARMAGVSAMAAKPIDPPRLRALAEQWARQAAEPSND